MTDELPEPPVVCPSWCTDIHHVEDLHSPDGLMHTSEPLRWEPPGHYVQERPFFPDLQFQLVSFEKPSGCTPPVLEFDVAGRQCGPYTVQIRTSTELDQLIAGFHQTIDHLTAWRSALPPR